MLAEAPPPVLPGALVGVAALSGVIDAQRLARGIAQLEALGFEARLARNLDRRDGLFAGDDGERLAAFHDLAADPAVEAIFFARGGHGALRLLPGIDWEVLSRRPRAYVGYSDLTPFLLQVVERLGLVALHGPMVATDLARGLVDAERETLLDGLAGTRAVEVAGAVVDLAGEGTETPEGPLLGGCLSLLAATQGTPFAPNLDGAILFWEDVNEPLYRIDRMLTHLRLSGSLRAIRGAVIGRVRGVDEPTETPSDVPRRMRDHAPRVPILWGVAAGHGAPNLTLPLGRRARLDAGAARLVVEER
jgi:muramoyltetrapeptide carboxypeptidase